MRPFVNMNARDVEDAVALARAAERDGKSVAFSGGGTDLLQQMKDRVVEPDLLVNLRTISGMREVVAEQASITIGGLITLDDLSRDPLARGELQVLAEAAESVGTPQIRNVGTLAGNVCQRPWCWYYRNGFPCYKAGGDRCFSVTGENGLHAIFGGGPSYIVHPSDLAPALVALDASFLVAGPDGERRLESGDFFVLPSVDPLRENALATSEMLTAVQLPRRATGTRSTYRKVMDREAWTHAVVSAAVVLEMDSETCTDARIVLGGVAPIPWRVPAADRLLVGQRVTPELARAVGEVALEGARPLVQSRYKVPLTRALVERTVLELANGSVDPPPA